MIIVATNKLQAPKSMISVPMPANRARQQDKIREEIALLKQSDSNFSSILFLDFVHSLYSKFYSYSNKPEFSYLSPFLGKAVPPPFQQTPALLVNEIVINGIQWQEIDGQGASTESICLVIDANYTAHIHEQRSRYAVTEKWRLYRKKGTLSPEPEKMQSLCCPSCGAPAHFTDAGQCDHCGSSIQNGEMQWYLGKRAVLKMTSLSASDLVSYAEEKGTRLPTIKQSDLAQQLAVFQQLHSLSNWDAFWHGFVKDIVEACFLSIYAHWSNRDWQAVRHLLSDRLYEANSFWLDLYREQNLFNRLENIKIGQVQLVKMEIDKFYEAITARIFASCFDYT
ncbi:MAG: TIM44-like domain-containing protein, partial [Methylococcales bacterium]